MKTGPNRKCTLAFREAAGAPSPARRSFADYAWQKHCCGLFQAPIAV